MDTLKITISKGNKKLNSIHSFSVEPVRTCANCAQCKKSCYALKMARLHKNVGESWHNNTEAFLKAPAAVEAAIIADATFQRFFRYFVGGDIINEDFLKMAVRIARKVKTCNFLMFTKKYEIVNEYLNAGGKIPKNLQVIFSNWRDQTAPNPHELPTSNILLKG